MPLASPKKRKELEKKIASTREQLKGVKQTRDLYREQRNDLRKKLKKSLEPRSILAQSLSGKGIEIGALHNPQALPEGVEVRYVDHFSREENVEHYSKDENVNTDDIVETHYVGDGEKLDMLDDESQDFLIANHMLEHCMNPIRTVENFLRVTRWGGRLFISLPDKRFTFDWRRPITPFSHILEDYKNDIQIEPIETYEEFRDLVAPKSDAQKAFENQSNIHFHVWAQTEIMEMFFRMASELDFPMIVERTISHGNETCLLIRKDKAEDEQGYKSEENP